MWELLECQYLFGISIWMYVKPIPDFVAMTNSFWPNLVWETVSNRTIYIIFLKINQSSSTLIKSYKTNFPCLSRLPMVLLHSLGVVVWVALYTMLPLLTLLLPPTYSLPLLTHSSLNNCALFYIFSNTLVFLIYSH